MGEEGKKGNPDKMGALKFWGWQMRAVSAGCVVIVLGYLSLYCTTVLMLPASLVGTLMLVSKVFDGVTDVFAGYLIDKTKTRWGKARPYEFCILALWLCTWLLFTCSAEWSTTVKAVWVFIMYTFVNSIFATFLNTNQTAYMVRAFPTQNQIVKLNSYGGIVVTIGCAVVSISFPILMGTMATSAAGWSKLMGIYALPLALIGMLRFLFVKETVNVDDNGAEVNIKGMLEVLKTNKYIYLIAGIGLLYNLTLGLNAGSYYFTYVVGDIGKYSLIAMLSMPMLIVMFVFPIALKKVTIAKLIMIGAVIGVAGGLLNFFAGSNMVLLMIAGACIAFAGLPLAYLSGLMILDCASFNETRGLPRMEGTLTAFTSFATKIGQGVGAALLGGILSMGGFDGAQTVQGDSTLLAIRLLYGIIPMIIFVLIAFMANAYKLDAKLKKLNSDSK